MAKQRVLKIDPTNTIIFKIKNKGDFKPITAFLL
jgi:hypothetical protein